MYVCVFACTIYVCTYLCIIYVQFSKQRSLRNTLWTCDLIINGLFVFDSLFSCISVIRGNDVKTNN